MNKKITDIIANYFADILLEPVGIINYAPSIHYYNLLSLHEVEGVNQIIKERIGDELKKRKKIQLANLLSKIKNDFSSCGKTHITKDIISEYIISKLVDILKKDIPSCIEYDRHCGYYILINQK